MHGKFDLLLKIRAKDLEQMRDIVVNKIRILPHILDIELMTVLKSRKEEQIVSLKNDISDKEKGSNYDLISFCDYLLHSHARCHYFKLIKN